MTSPYLDRPLRTIEQAKADRMIAVLRSALSWITVLTETSPSHAEEMRENEHRHAYLCDDIRAALALTAEG